MITRVAEAIRAARSVVVITGAGISAESGVPTFRGPGGLWRSYRPEDLATPEAFARDPRLVWEWYKWRRGLIAAARPNPGHLAIARLEQHPPHFLLVTQNVDGLHRRAGSRSLVEVHGNIWRSRCSVDREHDVADATPEGDGIDGCDQATAALPCCSCGALMRPDVVWFGEPLDARLVTQATAAVSECDVLLVVGTSAVVYPVAAWPSLARRSGALVVEVNVDETPLTRAADVALRGAAGEVLPALEAAS